MGKYASKNARRKYISYFADYLFWKIRFGSRTGSVSMGFTPNLLPGYSTVIFDRNRKHFVGHIQSLTHSITQAGGTTQVSLIALREHDEDIDFTEQGRTQEEVILGVAAGEDSDGTKDTFLDDRYSADNIGEKVYTPLYGTGSVLDLYDMFFETTDLSFVFRAGDGKVKKCTKDAAEVIFAAYKLMIANEGSVGTWTQGITHRPKANLVDILGFEQASSWTNFSRTAQSRMDGTMPGGGSYFDTANYPDVAGFMASAIDPTHDDANMTYTAKDSLTTYYTESYTVTEASTALDPYVEDGDACLESSYESVVKYRTKSRTVDKSASGTEYGTGGNVETRQAFVKAYVEGLLLKGLRG
jgi:hypothetical protein